MMTNGVKKQEQVTGNKQNNKNSKDGEKKTFAKMSVGEKVRHLREVVTVEPVMGELFVYFNISCPFLPQSRYATAFLPSTVVFE